MKLSIICNPIDFTGHGIHACQVIRRLPALLGCEMIVRPQRATGGVHDDIAKLVQSGENSAEWEIILGPPRIQPTKGKRTIYMTVNESTRLGKDSVQILNQAEIVIVPSQWCASTFSASGVDRPIYVVPLGFSEAFEYRPRTRSPVFEFACAGQWSNGPRRKGLQRVIDLFERAFSGTSGVRLTVKCMSFDQAPIPASGRVCVLATTKPESFVVGLLEHCDCFINLATGGFELFPLQAMSIGRPVISPCYGGITEYFNEQVGLVVAHHLVPAGDSWAGKGLWAEAHDDAVITAMQYAFNHPDEMQELGWKASWSVRHLTWENSIKKLANVLKAVMDPPREVWNLDWSTVVIKPGVGPSENPLDDVTVCITGFNRPKYLQRAIDSAMTTGMKVVVAEMTPENDLGCTQLWLQAAYKAASRYVIILHDDDVLLPELGEVMRRVIMPGLSRGYAVAWRGAHLWDDGKVTPTEYTSMSPNIRPIKELEEFLLQRGKLSLSPIVTVFERETLIHALKEADKYLTHYLHPSMPLGTEAIAHLRQQQGKNGWLYIDQVLSHYGVHPGSGTYAAEKSGDLSKLIAGYDQAREHFEQYRDERFVFEPTLLLLHSCYAGNSTEEAQRIVNARRTWSHHFALGSFMNFPVTPDMLKRSEDPPYLRDLLDLGCAHAMDEDIVVYANVDLALTAYAHLEIISGVKRSGGVAVAWRRSMPVPDRIIATSKGGKIDGGVDLIAVTPKWWLEHRHEMPDMFCCAQYYDWVFRIMAERVTGGKCYIYDGTYHEPHESMFSRLKHSTPAMSDNAKLAKEFFAARGMKREAESIVL